ncbi:MAG TPA: DinB family protein [Cyclobacteriaceae bacterium]
MDRIRPKVSFRKSNSITRHADKRNESTSEKQWKFKESPDRWSINEIVEHIAIWELLLDHQISRSLSAGSHPEFAKSARTDSIYLGFIMEEKPHISIEYTKPFTYTLPMGLNDLKNNVAWFLKMRNESVEYVKSTKDDLRAYFQKEGTPAVHQTYITLFGHTDRHLKQIRKVKQHPNYPK